LSFLICKEQQKQQKQQNKNKDYHIIIFGENLISSTVHQTNDNKN